MHLKFFAENSHETIHDSIEGWMTKAQISHHLNSESLAAALVAKKDEQGLSRPHPELPENKDATLYWVLKEISTKHRDVGRSGMRMEGGGIVSGEQAEEIAQTIDDFTTLKPPPALASAPTPQPSPAKGRGKGRGQKTKGKGKGRGQKTKVKPEPANSEDEGPHSASEDEPKGPEEICEDERLVFGQESPPECGDCAISEAIGK